MSVIGQWRSEVESRDARILELEAEVERLTNELEAATADRIAWRQVAGRLKSDLDEARPTRQPEGEQFTIPALPVSEEANKIADELFSEARNTPPEPDDGE